MPSVPNCFYRVSVKALILDEQKRFLLSLVEKGTWELPGGGLDFGEEPHEGLKRELNEEMGLEVISIEDQPSYVVTAFVAKQNIWKANVVYQTTVKNLNFRPSDECVKLRFFTKKEALKEKLNLGVKKFVKAYDPKNH